MSAEDPATLVEFRRFAEHRFAEVGTILLDVLTKWHALDLESDALAEDEYPFDHSLDDVLATVQARVETLQGRNDWIPEFRAFAEQNTDTMRDLRERPDLVEFVEGYAGHYSGGLMVLQKALGGHGRRFAKVHDTWGPGPEDGDGPIILHVYDADEDPGAGTFGPSEWVANFDSGVLAVKAFLDLPDAP